MPVFTWDDREIRALAARFDVAEDRLIAVLAQEAQPTARFLVQRVKANVPKKTGALEQHISEEVQAGPAFVGVELVADMPYAVAVHERPGPLDQSTPEGGRGPHFFTRVLDFYPELWEDPIQRTLQKLLRRS